MGIPIKFFTGKDAGEVFPAHDGEMPPGAGGAIRNLIAQRDDEPVDELGIPYRIHYLGIAGFAFFVALVPMLFALTPGGVELRNPVVVIVCAIAITAAPVLIYVGRRWHYEFKEWVFQIVLLYAIVGPTISQQFLNDLRPAILTLYMLGPIGAAFYTPLRRALPLIALGGGTILYVSTRIDEPDAMLRGIVVAVIAVSCALMMSVMKRHLVQTVLSNRELSERDALTGAYNLHKFDERMNEEIARSQREGSGFALIEFDLDHFKPVNEIYNHTVGDTVLVAAANAIQSALTPADLLVRRGGDEFAVIAPCAPDRKIAALVELARERVANARGELCPDLLPTVSTSWVIHDHHETAAAILRRADEALHAAKYAAREREAFTEVRRSQARTKAPKPPPPVHNVIELRQKPIDTDVIRDDPIAGAMRIAWRTAGIATFVLSVMLAVVGLSGQTSFDFSASVIALVLVWALVMAPLAIWASTRAEQPASMAYLVSATSLVLITLGCIAIGKAAPVAVEMYLLANITFMALLPAKPAAAYAAIGFGLYGYFLYASDYALADLRLTTTVVNFSCVGALLALDRQRTLEAASEKAQLARTDALTGLPNMRRLRDRLGYEIRRCKTTGGRLAVLMLDLDEFKSVNDKYSHSTGDEVLGAVADALERTARRADMPARRGGDEFVVVLTDADEQDAEAAARRVGDAIRLARLRIIADINPNASVGWVAWKPGESVDELINRADGALKRVKAMARRERHTTTVHMA